MFAAHTQMFSQMICLRFIRFFPNPFTHKQSQTAKTQYATSLLVLVQLASLIVLATAQTSPPCAVGQYETNNHTECTACDADSYCLDGVAMTACPAHSNTGGSTGSTAKTQCNCENTYYRDANSNCVLCPAGYRCANNAHTACGVGTYSHVGSSVCTSCPLGTFEDTVAQPNCEVCPAGLMIKKAWTATELNSAVERPMATGNNQIYIMRTFLAAAQGKNLSQWSFYAVSGPCTVTPMVFTATVDGRNTDGNFYYTLSQTGTTRTVQAAGAYTFDFIAGEQYTILAAAPEYVRPYMFFGWKFTGDTCIPYDESGATQYVLQDNYVEGVSQYYYPETAPTPRTYSVGITYSWTTDAASTTSEGSTSIFDCSCSAGTRQLSDGNCQGFCIPGTYMHNETDNACTTCSQGSFCVNSVQTACAAGYSSLPGAIQCSVCDGPGTNSNMQLYMCGMLSCADTPYNTIGPYWRGLGKISVVTGGSAAGIPQTPWFPGSIISKLVLNPSIDRPVAILVREITVTPSVPIAFQFRVLCSGLTCDQVEFQVSWANKQLVAVSSPSDYTMIYHTFSVSSTAWTRVSTVYITPSSSVITLRVFSKVASLNSVVWMDSVRVVSLGTWTYSSVSDLLLQDSVHLSVKRSPTYNKPVLDASVLQIGPNAWVQNSISSFGPDYIYYITAWVKGSSSSSSFKITTSSATATPSVIVQALTTTWTLYEFATHSPSSARFENIGSDPVSVALLYAVIRDPMINCQSCLDGSWCSGQHIYTCPDHSTSVAGVSSQSQCTCLPGYYGNQLYQGVGYTPCSICPVNYFCTGGNNVEVCPAGTKAVAGSSVCVQCAPNEICKDGAVGSCPLHSNSPTGSSLVTDCVCDDGYYGTAPDCQLCTPGSYCNSGVRTQCTASATSTPGATNWTQCYCDRGYYGVANAACTACEPGYWCWTGIRNNCPFNSFSLTTSSYVTNCTCNPGYYGPDGGPCAQCSAGSYKAVSGNTDCALCPVGTFSTDVGAVSLNSCSVCPTGTYNPIVGQYACVPCSEGSYGPLQQATSCQPCWAGSYSYAGASTCSLCSTGTKSAVVSATSPLVCQPCQVGSWSAGNATVCVDCGVCYYWAFPARVFMYTGALTNLATIDNSYRYRFCKYSGGVVVTEFRTMYAFNIDTRNSTNMNILFPGNAFNSLTALPNSKYIYAIQPPNLFRIDTQLNLWDTVYPASLPQGVLVNSVGLWIAQSDGVKCLDPADTTQIYFFPITGGANWICAHDLYPGYIYVVTSANGFKRIQISNGASTTLNSMTGLTNCEFTNDGRFALLARTTASELWAYSMFDTEVTKIMSNAIITDMLILDNNTVMVGVEGQGIMNIAIDVKDSRDCPLGKYSSYSGLQNEGQCTTCPAGSLCPGGAVIAQCTPGTYSFSVGLRQQSQCAICPAGYYCPGGASRTLCPAGSLSLVTGLTVATDCQLCPVNKYCPNSTSVFSCPANTLSAPMGKDLSDCKCAPGFKCELTKVVHAEVILPFTQSTFTPAIQQIYKEAVALAAGVDVSQVNIISISEIQFGTQRRRRNLLGQDELSPTDVQPVLDVHTSIYNSVRTDMDDLNTHLMSKGLPAHKGVKVTMHKEVVTSYKVGAH